MHGREANPADCCFPAFPTAAGKRTDARTWCLPDALVAEWGEAFPAVDVLAECRRAHAWVIANLGRRKTASGMPVFLFRWMARCQDGGGSRVGPDCARRPTRHEAHMAEIERALSMMEDDAI